MRINGLRCEAHRHHGIIDKYASLINKDARASDGDVGGVS